MIELPAHLHLFPLSSATLNAISFKYVYETESLKTLQTFPSTVWKQGSQGWQQGQPGSGLPGKGTACSIPLQNLSPP